MTLEQREAHIVKLRDQRKSLQKQIGELEVKRQAFIADERAKQSPTTASTLGEALKAAVREQATKKGYVFDAPATPAKQPDEKPADEPVDASGTHGEPKK